jgi:hypothetical protein
MVSPSIKHEELVGGDEHVVEISKERQRRSRASRSSHQSPRQLLNMARPSQLRTFNLDGIKSPVCLAESSEAL